MSIVICIVLLHCATTVRVISRFTAE